MERRNLGRSYLHKKALFKWRFKFIKKQGYARQQSLHFKRVGKSIEAERVPLKRKLSALTEFIRSSASPVVSPFYTGWEHESLGFVANWFFKKISGKKPAKIQYASLGVGNGVKVLINEEILRLFGFKDVDVFGIDVNRSALRRAVQLNPKGVFQRVRLPANENFLREHLGKFHIVESTNLLHEVYGKPRNLVIKWKNVDSVLGQARSLIGAEGGIFLVHDGILPERSENLVRARLSPRYARALRVFCKTLSSKSARWISSGKGKHSMEVELSLGDLSKFLSKARYLVESGWRNQYPPRKELRQTYPFASMNEMASHLLEANFDAVIAMSYSDRAIRNKWARNCLVQGSELPHNYGRFFAFVLPKNANKKDALRQIESLADSLAKQDLPSLADEEIGRIKFFLK